MANTLCSSTGTRERLKLRDATDGQVKATFGRKELFQGSSFAGKETIHGSSIHTALSPDGAWLAVGGDAAVTVWDLNKRELLFALPGRARHDLVHGVEPRQESAGGRLLARRPRHLELAQDQVRTQPDRPGLVIVFLANCRTRFKVVAEILSTFRPYTNRTNEEKPR